METQEKLRNELSELFEKLKKCLVELPQEEKSQESGDSSSHILEDPTKQLFEDIIKKVDDSKKQYPEDSDFYVKLIAMKASTIYEQAKLKLSKGITDESRELLQKTISEMGSLTEHRLIRFLYLRVVNHLSYLYSRIGELEKAKELLEDVMSEDPPADITVYSTEELFTSADLGNEGATSKLNKLMVNNMQMLAWVYGKLGMHEDHTLMQHKALQKQLDTAESDPLQWACRCCRLSTLFLTQCQWVHARYHLAAAGVILERITATEGEDYPELKQAKADLARAWIHYGLHLFSVSKKIILDRIYYNEETISEEEMAPAEDPLPPEYEFSGITVNPPDIPAVQIITTEQARNLFLNTHSWLKQARVFYTLRDYPLHYVNAVLDLSELYRFLAFYEADLDSQYNVQKRRADTLETLTTILREIRPTCYVSVSVELLRELTEVQIELLGINLKRLFMAEGVKDNEESMNRRIAAVSDLHSKLESLGNMMGNSTYDLQSLEPGTQNETSAETVETNEALCDDAEQGTGELVKEVTVENKETPNENGKMPDGNADTSLPSTSNSVP